jgi:hypothetical protein
VELPEGVADELAVKVTEGDNAWVPEVVALTEKNCVGVKLHD